MSLSTMISTRLHWHVGATCGLLLVVSDRIANTGETHRKPLKDKTDWPRSVVSLAEEVVRLNPAQTSS